VGLVAPNLPTMPAAAARLGHYWRETVKGSMPAESSAEPLLAQGQLSFSVESRVLRELGERLVKQPEVALVELVKNAYDADANVCEIETSSAEIVVKDDGHGMTLDAFTNGWMRIGTGMKTKSAVSRRFKRAITGEKGIGRFAVRFLGRTLHLESVAHDKGHGGKTKLTADFHWASFDHAEDLGEVTVPYQLHRASESAETGTTLSIGQVRSGARAIDLSIVRTASISLLTPFHSLLSASDVARDSETDPGFSLRLGDAADQSDGDVAQAMLDNFVLRAVLKLTNQRLELSVFRRGRREPHIQIGDRYDSAIGHLYADIRFFPKRKGTYSGLGVDGRRARTWIKENSGVQVFDRAFRVTPYGSAADDWLGLARDAAKRARDPVSSITKKHFSMDAQTKASTQLNYMLRLPYPQQLVGVVQVKGQRADAIVEEGLVPSADREGFVDNEAFRHLQDVVRGAIEAIAVADREIQQEEERKQQAELLRSIRSETRSAVQEVEANPNIPRAEKARVVKRLLQAQVLAEQHDERGREQVSALEAMSLLGIVAGFMTHEFGTAVSELERAQERLSTLARRDSRFKEGANAIATHLTNLRDLVTYSQGYIQGATVRPAQAYPARPRIQQVVRVFGRYAEQRKIAIVINVERDVIAPLVPVSLYSGVALNLFTNALKACTAAHGSTPRQIAFRAWNAEHWHHLVVSDTGIGIPAALRERVFDPLFTTTASNKDPLGSGMGLGLSFVRRGVESYGGRVDVIDPEEGFTTAVHVKIPA
jgi:signal transduction histidine kinase